MLAVYICLSLAGFFYIAGALTIFTMKATDKAGSFIALCGFLIVNFLIASFILWMIYGG